MAGLPRNEGLNVSIVIPHKEGDPLNIPIHDPGDEVLVVEGLGAGEARIRGASEAVNDWVITVDADGTYPPDYVGKAKSIIVSGRYPGGFKARRLGGLASGAGQEAGIVVPKSLFLEQTANFVPDGRWDVGYLFRGLPIVPELTYYHGLTFGERTIAATGGLAAAGILAVWLFGRKGR